MRKSLVLTTAIFLLVSVAGTSSSIANTVWIDESSTLVPAGFTPTATTVPPTETPVPPTETPIPPTKTPKPPPPPSPTPATTETPIPLLPETGGSPSPTSATSIRHGAWAVTVLVAGFLFMLSTVKRKEKQICASTDKRGQRC